MSPGLITLAVSKGRILDEVLPMLESIGVLVSPGQMDSRSLIFSTNDPKLQLILVRAADVPTYVRYGGADMGIVGSDVLQEQGAEGVYQPLDLGIARCSLCVATRVGFNYSFVSRSGARLRVATKYPNITRTHFSQKGVHVDLIKLYGSMELAPLVGLSHVIVDLVSTGGTLRANGLVAVDDVMDVSARLVLNSFSLKRNHAFIEPFLAKLSKAVHR